MTKEEYKDAIEVSVIFHEGQRMFAVPKQPAQRHWVGLTDEEITDIWAGSSPYYHEDDFARAIEAKLKEKNT